MTTVAAYYNHLGVASFGHLHYNYGCWKFPSHQVVDLYLGLLGDKH